MRAFRRRLLVAAVVLVPVLSACSGGTDAVDQTAGSEFRFVAGTGKGEVIPVADRRPAPTITAPLLDGDAAFDLSSLDGKVVVLNFWASWCAPCRVESPEFDQVYRARRASGVEVVGVATKDERRAALAFVDRYKISFRNLYDPTGAVTLRFRGLTPRAFPYTILLDKQGRVAAVYPVPLLREDLEPVVLRLAAER